MFGSWCALRGDTDDVPVILHSSWDNNSELYGSFFIDDDPMNGLESIEGVNGLA